MPLKVQCSCGRQLVAEDRHAGGAIRCKACRRPVFVPHTAERFERRDEEMMIRAYCECGKRIKAKTKYAGCMGVCPRCGKSVQLPELRDAEFIDQEASGTGIAGWIARQELVDTEEPLVAAELDDPSARPAPKPFDRHDPQAIARAAEAALETRQRMRQQGRLRGADAWDELALLGLAGKMSWPRLMLRGFGRLVSPTMYRRFWYGLQGVADRLARRRRRDQDRGAAFTGFRGLINTYPEISVSLVVVAVLSAAWFAWRTETIEGQASEGGGEQAFFVDLATGELSASRRSPTGLRFGSSVETGLVQVVMFGCGGCESEHQRFVGYLQVYPRTAREAIEKVAASDLEQPVEVDPGGLEAWQRGPIMRRPQDPDDAWVHLSSEKARERIASLSEACPENVRLVPCRPGG